MDKDQLRMALWMAAFFQVLFTVMGLMNGGGGVLVGFLTLPGILVVVFLLVKIRNWFR